MWWMRGYESGFSTCGPPRSCVRSSWCWHKVINIIWRESGRVREERGKEERRKRGRRRKAEKMRGNKSNIELELFNFRYHRNCYWDFVNKLQINTANRTYDHISSDKAPFNYVLRSISNREKKIWNTHELLDANRNTGGTESISARLVNTSCIIENIDSWGYNTE